MWNQSPGKLCTLFLFGLVLACGCDSKKVADVVNQVKKQVATAGKSASDSAQDLGKRVTETVQKQSESLQSQVKQHINPGKVQLQLDAPTVIDQCFWAFTPATDARPGVLQFRTYADPGSETSPALFVWATTDARDISMLAGQSLEAQVFVQLSEESGVWHSPPQQPARLAVSGLRAERLSAEIASGSLVSARQGSVQGFSLQCEAIAP